jgi:hypothetical protein
MTLKERRMDEIASRQASAENSTRGPHKGNGGIVDSPTYGLATKMLLSVLSRLSER